ncbi:RDD family protein [Aquimarina sp. D1M17]|uniref:RDD family protein n=1 Tax=Aquimarina acroporae TaxID=2937283 RepID=UPI0020C0D91E|nr:RDD family protein [Aquimarina acroporae]MCK8520420.1 RDD family protein [Aquimarina acroporae]
MNETEYKGILHKEVNNLARINPRFHRISSMLLDHIIMIMVIVPPIILVIILAANGILEIENRAFYIFFFFMMFIYLNKDFFHSKSPAKRILGYQVINRKNEQPATELQCFIRNLTIAIAWPLEVIVGLINPERRIGDFLANTKVVTSEKEKIKSIWTDLKNIKLKINFIGILIIGGLYFYGLSLLLPGMN